MKIDTALYDHLDKTASDRCWTRTQLFRNLNGDRCIRSRWEKGRGSREVVMYISVNVDTNSLDELRVIKCKYEIETENTVEAVIATIENA